MKNLNRLKALYDLITKRNGEIISMDEIIAELPEYYSYSDTKSHDKCPMLWSDINEINNSIDFEKIIINDKWTYRTATKDEAKDYANQYFIKGKKALYRYARIMEKIKIDNQIDLLTNLTIKTLLDNKNY